MQEQLWQNICFIAARARNPKIKIPEYISLSLSAPLVGFDEMLPEEFQVLIGINQAPPQTGFPSLMLENLLELKPLYQNSLEDQLLIQLQTYLPIALLAYEARRRKRTIAISHFAQSLDGKIATFCGDSKWIGNAENLRHAHRLRALCDAILVGNNTVRQDKPSLTVRKVSGPNPQRIILGTQAVDLSSLIAASPEKIMRISPEFLPDDEYTICLCLQQDTGRIPGKEILEKLFQHGIHSVLVEGGSKTTSSLLDDQVLDIVQLHLAPLIFGSGKSGIKLPHIQSVDQAVEFKFHRFQPMGDGMMFTGLIS
ncbi:MAG: RibD family protein [Saprospiraceae bacterium]|nr:RibD family protein [Saprospiraceae bacterium]